MSHHGSSPLSDFNSDDFKKLREHGFEQLFKDRQIMPEFGATGKFPNGKIDPHDEGEIKIGITQKDGTVIMSFGKNINWVGFTKEQAKQIAESLLKHAEQNPDQQKS